MKEEVKVIELDKPAQGVMYAALKDLHDKRLAEGKATAPVDEVIGDLYTAPVKMRKVRAGEAR